MNITFFLELVIHSSPAVVLITLGFAQFLILILIIKSFFHDLAALLLVVNGSFIHELTRFGHLLPHDTPLLK